MTTLPEKVVILHGALRAARVPHAFGGAIALGYYAVPRATIDIDLNIFLPATRYERVERALRRAGVDRFPAAADVARDEQCRAWWGRNPVDLFFSYDAIHDAMQKRVRTVPFAETTIPILAAEHLLVAKVVFNRPKDWIDIEHVLIAAEDLDIAEIASHLLRYLPDEDERRTRLAKLIADTRGSDP